MDVLVIGYNTTDMVLNVNEEIIIGEKLHAKKIQYYGGGQAANCAYTLSKLGANVSYLGKFGDDPNGVLSMNSLKEADVCVKNSKIIENCNNHLGIIIVDDSSGERTIIMQKDQRLAMHKEDINAYDLKDIKILYTDGNESEFTLTAAKLAYEAGISVIADMEIINKYTAEIFPYLSVLIAPEKIIKRLADTEDMILALQKLKLTVDIVVATEGKNGSTGIDSTGRIIHVSAETCEVVDTTGAGDAFHSGYVMAVLKKMSFEDSLKYATHIAALKCEVSGPRIKFN